MLGLSEVDPDAVGLCEGVLVGDSVIEGVAVAVAVCVEEGLARGTKLTDVEPVIEADADGVVEADGDEPVDALVVAVAVSVRVPV